MSRTNYAIVKDLATHMIIEDLGPWDKYMTVTNAAEEVVQELAPRLGSKRLFYIDSEGQCDELKVEGGRFIGYSQGCPFYKQGTSNEF
jgi:hypothetical protein